MKRHALDLFITVASLIFRWTISLRPICPELISLGWQNQLTNIAQRSTHTCVCVCDHFIIFYHFLSVWFVAPQFVSCFARLGFLFLDFSVGAVERRRKWHIAHNKPIRRSRLCLRLGDVLQGNPQIWQHDSFCQFYITRFFSISKKLFLWIIKNKYYVLAFNIIEKRRSNLIFIWFWMYVLFFTKFWKSVLKLWYWKLRNFIEHKRVRKLPQYSLHIIFNIKHVYIIFN